MDEHDEEPDLDDLRKLMHERVDAVFDQANGPLGIEGAALQLCAQLPNHSSICMSGASCRLVP